MCGLRTRPRTDVDPLQVELPSAGAYRLAALFSRSCCLSLAVYAQKIPFALPLENPTNSSHGHRIMMRVSFSSDLVCTRAMYYSARCPSICLISSHLLFFKNSCQTTVYKVHTHTYRYNEMLWRQTGNDSNDTAIIKRNCVYKVHTPMHTIKMLW